MHLSARAALSRPSACLLNPPNFLLFFKSWVWCCNWDALTSVLWHQDGLWTHSSIRPTPTSPVRPGKLVNWDFPHHIIITFWRTKYSTFNTIHKPEGSWKTGDFSVTSVWKSIHRTQHFRNTSWLFLPLCGSTIQEQTQYTLSNIQYTFYSGRILLPSL